MIRLILTLVLVFFIACLGYLLQRHDFAITAEMQGYLVETSAARLAVIAIVFIALTYALLRLVFWLKNSPHRVLQKIRKNNEQQAYRNIMSGFSALAAGDAARARKFADKADRVLPQEALVKLLQAQIAVNSGQGLEAENYYKALTTTEEGKFAGFRGLVAQAMNNNKPERALQIASDLLRDNPKSAWLNEALIDLAFRVSDWDKLERYLKKAEANKALEKAVLKEKFAVYYAVKARLAQAEGRLKDAEWLGERALKYKADFLPAAIILSGLYVEEEEYKKVRKLVARFWAVAPHPQLAKNYELALRNSGIRDKSKRVKRLYEKNPDDIDSIEFYARVLLDEKHKETAYEILQHGLSIRQTRGLCELMAQIDDKVSWLAKAAAAEGNKCWHCRVTNARYAEWQPYSDSGELDTIEWGFPSASGATPKSALAHSDFLSIGKP